MGINGNVYASETPHFFQVIMPRALQLGKLEIPINFVRKYGEMSIAGRESVCLAVPNGDAWTVGVENSSDNVMLGEGWKEFMEHYSLGEGSFVFFRFEPVESLFAVLIFNEESSIEIKYPPKRPVFAAATAHPHRVKVKKETNRSESESESSDQETDDDDDFLPDVAAAAATAHPHHVKIKEKTNQSESKSSDQETDDDDDEDSEYEEDEDEDDFLPENAECATDYKARAHLQNLRSKSSTFRPLRTPFKGKSGNPSFRMRIQPSYLKPKSRVTLPHVFVVKNKLNKKLKVKLRLLGYEKIWQLRIFYRDNERRGELSNAGWHRFCSEVGIRVGDHCEFELTSRVGNKVFFTMSIIA